MFWLICAANPERRHYRSFFVTSILKTVLLLPTLLNTNIHSNFLKRHIAKRSSDHFFYLRKDSDKIYEIFFPQLEKVDKVGNCSRNIWRTLFLLTYIHKCCKEAQKRSRKHCKIYLCVKYFD